MLSLLFREAQLMKLFIPKWFWNVIALKNLSHFPIETLIDLQCVIFFSFLLNYFPSRNCGIQLYRFKREQPLTVEQLFFSRKTQRKTLLNWSYVLSLIHIVFREWIFTQKEKGFYIFRWLHGVNNSVKGKQLFCRILKWLRRHEDKLNLTHIQFTLFMLNQKDPWIKRSRNKRAGLMWRHQT